MRYATLPVIQADLYREMSWLYAMSLLASLTEAGEDPIKVKAVIARIDQFNAVNAQVIYQEK